MYQVCDGIRVLEVAAWTFVPAAGAVLADWGAEVIKVEHPTTGDPQRGLFNAMTPEGGGPNPMLELPNRGKRGIALNLASDEGRELLYRLAERSDVFLTSYLPDARAKLQIDLDDIRARNPSIVYARGSGWGPRGPDAEKPGFDLASTWVRGGISYNMTPADADEPAMMPGSIGDLTGGVTLAGAIAAALFRRERTGEPQEVDVSLYGVGMWMQGQSITAARLGMTLPRITRDNPNPLVRPYRTKDHRWLWLVFLQPDPWWPDLCHHLERPELIDDPRFADIQARGANRDACVAILDDVFASRTLDEWRSAFATLQGAWAPALSPFEIIEDPQVHANGYLPDVGGAEYGYSYGAVASPMQFGGKSVGALRPMPEHGQHTEEVLLELGLSWDDIAAYKDRAVIP